MVRGRGPHQRVGARPGRPISRAAIQPEPDRLEFRWVSTSPWPLDLVPWLVNPNPSGASWGLWVLAWWTTAILLALAVVAVMPIRGGASAVLSDDDISGRVELGWGFGVLQLSLASNETSRMRLLGVWSIPLPTARWPSKVEKKQERKLASIRRRWASMRSVRPAVGFAMACRLVQVLHIRVLFSGRLGLADPADAATLETATLISREIGPTWLEVDVLSDPLEQGTELFGRARFWILPAEVLGVLASWVLRPETRRVLRALR